ncbi:cupin domain-containing protein [Myxococcota bacterium]|nr:cupin domain-containing protein [Myxococcota bacterium]MBU1379979.1 cupin domain-containing protein [Myxococcota bacterium]MBU1497766.1 cupin domain-containing protein [Myxococcota bacterium]
MFAFLLFTLLTGAGKIDADLAMSLSRCHQISRARDLKISGKLQMVVDLDSEGKAVSVRLQKDDVKSPVLLRCVRYHLSQATFKREKGKKNITLKLNFPRSNTQMSVFVNDVPLSTGLGNKCAVRNLLDTKNTGAKKGSMVVLRIAKSGKLSEIAHLDSNAYFLVTQGSGTFDWESSGQRRYHPVSKGSFLMIPAKKAFSIRGLSDPPLVMVVFFDKSGPQEFYSGNLSSKHVILASPEGFSAKQKALLLKNKIDVVTADVVLDKNLKNGLKSVFQRKGFAFTGIAKIKPGKKYYIGRAGEVFGFILQGGGEIIAGTEISPFRSGSGVHFAKNVYLLPGMKNSPVIMLYFSTYGNIVLK